jgi:aryl-alcohol dehydrogenase-like predicted oxidoreductase
MPGSIQLNGLDQSAQERSTSVAAVALAWLRAQPTVSTPIASATKLEQIKELMPVLKLSESELQALTSS